MKDLRLRHLLIPAYVGLCLLIGGSAQGIAFNVFLQLLAIGLLAWAALTRRPSMVSGEARFLSWVIVGTAFLFLLQLVPLPPALWTALPGREPVAAGYRMLGMDLPWLPWSLTPQQTIASGLALLPPLAVYAGIVRLGAYRSNWLAGFLVGATLLGVALGAFQVSSQSGYLYPYTSRGLAAGFFANANYLGTLLIVAIPFLAAIVARRKGSAKRAGSREVGLMAMAGGGLTLLILGLALNRSMAALILALPAILASALIVIKPAVGPRKWLLAAAALAAVGGILAYSTIPEVTGNEASVSIATRQDIYRNSAGIAAETFPAGTGIGSFAQIYPRSENPDMVDSTFVNHVHNDYLEVVLETGLAGLLLIITFLFWWARNCVRIWRSPVSGSMARAATIASAAILAHSLVDFPLRTAAVAAVFAMSVALMAEPRSRRHFDEGEEARLRPARHLALD